MRNRVAESGVGWGGACEKRAASEQRGSLARLARGLAGLGGVELESGITGYLPAGRSVRGSARHSAVRCGAAFSLASRDRQKGPKSSVAVSPIGGAGRGCLGSQRRTCFVFPAAGRGGAVWRRQPHSIMADKAGRGPRELRVPLCRPSLLPPLRRTPNPHPRPRSPDQPPFSSPLAASLGFLSLSETARLGSARLQP